MTTIQEALRSVTMYPIPSSTLQSIATRRGCVLSDEATKEKLLDTNFNLAKADLLMWLSLSPNVAQGGQNYSFTDEQRQQFRNEAKGLYTDFASDCETQTKNVYGYKGSIL